MDFFEREKPAFCVKLAFSGVTDACPFVGEVGCKSGGLFRPGKHEAPVVLVRGTGQIESFIIQQHQFLMPDGAMKAKSIEKQLTPEVDNGNTAFLSVTVKDRSGKTESRFMRPLDFLVLDIQVERRDIYIVGFQLLGCRKIISMFFFLKL